MTEIGVEAEFALEEPSLKFHRLANDCPESYAKTEITTVAAHYKVLICMLSFIVLGYMNGTLDIFDHLGNLIQNGRHRKHFCPINQIGISDDGDFVVSCADDGFVFVYNLLEPELNELINLKRQIKAVAISPEYSRTKRLVTGGKALTLHSLGVFGRRSAEELYLPQSGVQNIKWRKSILIWADDSSVYVYNLRRRQLINYIPKPPSTSDPTFSATWSSSVSNDDRESLISIPESSISGSLTPSKQSVQIAIQHDLAQDDTVGVICGIAAHNDRVLVLLCPQKSIESLLVGTLDEDASHNKPPQLLVADVGEALCAPACQQTDTASVLSATYPFEEVSREDVLINLSPSYSCRDVGLATVPGEDTHFVFSHVDIICAQVLSADDRVDWYLEQDLPQRALQIASEHSGELVRHSLKQLGMTYLDKLIEEENYLGAARLCNNILTDKKSWEDQVFRFLHLGQLHILVPYLPTAKNLITSSTYEVILIDLLSKSPSKFLQKLKDWPPSSRLYSLNPIIAAVEERTSSYSHQDVFTTASQDPEMHALWRALVVLYENVGLPEKGLEISIKLKDPDVYDLLQRQLPGTQGGCFGSIVRKNIVALFEIDIQRALVLMIDCLRELPVDFVVQELDSQPMLLFKYLDALNTRNPQAAVPHVHRLVKLYASYARDQLLPFLRSTHQYPLNEALALCQSLNYVPETVYLLTRVGRRKDALKLLMEKGSEDAFLFGDKALTPEQRQAEVAAQAIAYCLEEDSAQGRPYFTAYDNSEKRRTLRMDRDRSDCLDEDSELREDEEMCATSSSLEAGELWNQVVLFAVDKPTFICALLKHASTESIDPSLLLRRIAPETEIPHLKESLVNLLHNTQMQIELRRSCHNILLKDSHEMFSRLVQVQGRGMRVNIQPNSSRGVCRVCRQALLSPESSQGHRDVGEGGALHQPALAVFRCSHTFHQACLSLFGRFIACPVCVQDRVAA
ncbi:unnamed protein product [Mesocestoides corti]|uniref:RING-type domain-containing protein n=1 Tax=Mesocestoides corti TaxID=53468 RepID=A0A158QVF9_MESCO|nr:unnamed protein product [Mesocestoides corti]